MKSLPSLGEQEIEILRYVAECKSATVREVAEHFEKEKGLARTTILTVMERLRGKGLLTREKVNGVFAYSQKVDTGTVIKSRISDFVEKTLGGSAAPLIHYFAGQKKITAEEIEQLRSIVEAFDKKRGKNL